MGKLVGTTRIELTNVRTGEKEVHEDHNMVTNALRDIFKPVGLCTKGEAYIGESSSKYYETLLGGILCFDTALEEDPNKYLPPADASVIGCGVYGVLADNTNITRGSYNSHESEVNLEDRYIKYVYDFNTAQANGTIASVCLTHKNGGYTSYGSPKAVNVKDSICLLYNVSDSFLQYVMPKYTGAKTRGRTADDTGVNQRFLTDDAECIFLIDRDADCAVYFKVVDSTHVHIIKRRAFLKSVSVFDDSYTTKPLVEEREIVLEKELKQYKAYNYDTETDNLYICSFDNEKIEVGQEILITEIAYDSLASKQYTVTNAAEFPLVFFSIYSASVSKGYLYVNRYVEYGQSIYNFCKININNSADITLFSSSNNTNKNYLSPMMFINGRLYARTNYYSFLIANTKSDEITQSEIVFGTRDSFDDNYSFVPAYHEPLWYYVECGTKEFAAGWLVLCNYLATINNLDRPVTKTAEKTMKITYILQEE